MVIILGICGRRGAGKDTFASALAPLGYRRVAFADPLKDVARRLFRLSHAQVHGTVEQKETPDPRWTTPEHPEGLTPRFILQRLGTEVGRTIHPDIWVYALLHHIDECTAGLDGGIVLRFALTDVRFPNEVAAIRARAGGRIVKLVRTDYAVDTSIADHDSERLVDAIQADWTVEAPSGRVDLIQAAALRIASEITEGEEPR